MEVVATQTIPREDDPRFYDVAHPITARVVEGKETVTVRFQAKAGEAIKSSSFELHGVFIVRMPLLTSPSLSCSRRSAGGLG